MNREQLKQNYENACNAYLKIFCEKHGYGFEDAKDSWISGKAGTVTCVADLYIDMEVITTDIDTDAPEDEFVKWYDYCLELGMLGVTSTPNYSSWLKGCPVKTEAEIQEIRQAKERADNARRELENLIEKHSQKKNQ